MAHYDEFENVIIKGIHISRYVASWTKYCTTYDLGFFEEWLKTLEFDDDEKHLTDEEIQRIVYYAECGKLELETSVKHYLNGLDDKAKKWLKWEGAE